MDNEQLKTLSPADSAALIANELPNDRAVMVFAAAMIASEIASLRETIIRLTEEAKG